LQPNTALLRDVVNLSESGHVPTDTWMKTARDGLYAVGDIRQDSAAQAITSAGDGATAAIAAHRYIKEMFR
jgi:thioredoxin reductase (NADPH)